MKYFKTTWISIILIATLFLGYTAANAQQNLKMDDLQGKWEMLPDKSDFSFKSKTFGIFTVKGTMGGLKGSIDFDKINTDNFVNLSLKPASLNTGIDKRDEHLRSEDFFYVGNFPLIEFKGGIVELQNQEDQSYLVHGTLTIRGITHEEAIPVKLEGYYNNEKNIIEFTGSLEIDRNKYDVDYTGRLIADMAKINYKLVVKKK